LSFCHELAAEDWIKGSKGNWIENDARDRNKENPQTPQKTKSSELSFAAPGLVPSPRYFANSN
jgi:hypothetical protein